MNYHDEITNVHALHMHGIPSILIIILHYIPFLKSKLYLKFDFQSYLSMYVVIHKDYLFLELIWKLLEPMVHGLGNWKLLHPQQII